MGRSVEGGSRPLKVSFLCFEDSWTRFSEVPQTFLNCRPPPQLDPDHATLSPSGPQPHWFHTLQVPRLRGRRGRSNSDPLGGDDLQETFSSSSRVRVRVRVRGGAAAPPAGQQGESHSHSRLLSSPFRERASSSAPPTPTSAWRSWARGRMPPSTRASAGRVV